MVRDHLRVGVQNGWVCARDTFMMITELKKDFFSPFFSNPFECLCNSVSFENQIAFDTVIQDFMDWTGVIFIV